MEVLSILNQKHYLFYIVIVHLSFSYRYSFEYNTSDSSTGSSNELGQSSHLSRQTCRIKAISTGIGCWPLHRDTRWTNKCLLCKTNIVKHFLMFVCKTSSLSNPSLRSQCQMSTVMSLRVNNWHISKQTFARMKNLSFWLGNKQTNLNGDLVNGDLSC